MSQINIIAAIDKGRVIGKNNDLVWKGAPGDMKRFKEITTGHPIIMGRKTLESFGQKMPDGSLLLKPLPNRTNIVVTRNTNLQVPGCFFFQSLEEAIKFAKERDEQVFVIGGGEIYSQAIGLADRLYLTMIDAEADGDIFFPEHKHFTKLVSSEEMSPTEKFPHKYKFVVLEK